MIARLRAFTSSGDGDGTYRAPSAFCYSSLGGVIATTYSATTPLHKGHRFAFMGDADVVAFVVLLLCVIGPLKVSWFVMAISIDAIYRAFRRWPHSYFRNEMLKGRKAKFNASAAVVCVRNALRVSASLLGRLVNSILGCRSKSMSLRAGRNFFISEATAAFSLVDKVAGSYCDYITAFASTKPHAASIPLNSGRYSGIAKNCKSAKCFAGAIDEVFVVWERLKNGFVRDNIGLSHDNSYKFDWLESHAGSSLHGFRHSTAVGS